LTTLRTIATAVLFALAACTGPTSNDVSEPLPERVLLHYDFSGDWMAAAGDQCSERLDLSETVFLTVVASPDGAPDRYHIADFFMLEPGEPAEAIVGVADGNGNLELSVETEGIVDGKRAAITYKLLLEQESARIMRLRGFDMLVRDSGGRTSEIDLLAEAANDPSIPVLGAQGNRGLCLKRLPR
jgi:hypothetical protein